MNNAAHKAVNGGAKGLVDRIRELSSHQIGVGVPSDMDEDGRQKTDDIGNADLVYIHTHGVRPEPMRTEMQTDINKGTKYSIALQMYLKAHGSVTMQIPPRPIIEPAIEKHKDETAESMKDAAVAAANGDDYMQSLKDAGQQARDIVKGYFNEENGWAPNALATVKQKGSSQPLIDTGAMRQSISFTIDGVTQKND